MSLEETIAKVVEEAVRRVVREELAANRGPDLLTTDQAAALAGVTPKTIREWVLSGKLRRADGHGRAVRVTRADLEACLRGVDPAAAELLRTLPSGR